MPIANGRHKKVLSHKSLAQHDLAVLADPPELSRLLVGGPPGSGEKIRLTN
jgi:hypothetical protein